MSLTDNSSSKLPPVYDNPDLLDKFESYAEIFHKIQGPLTIKGKSSSWGSAKVTNDDVPADTPIEDLDLTGIYTSPAVSSVLSGYLNVLPYFHPASHKTIYRPMGFGIVTMGVVPSRIAEDRVELGWIIVGDAYPADFFITNLGRVGCRNLRAVEGLNMKEDVKNFQESPASYKAVSCTFRGGEYRSGWNLNMADCLATITLMVLKTINESEGAKLVDRVNRVLDRI